MVAGERFPKNHPPPRSLRGGHQTDPTWPPWTSPTLTSLPAAVQGGTLSPLAHTLNPAGPCPILAWEQHCQGGFTARLWLSLHRCRHPRVLLVSSPPTCPCTLPGRTSVTCLCICTTASSQLGHDSEQRRHGLHGCLKPGHCLSTMSLPCLQPGCAWAGELLPAATLHPCAPPSKLFLLICSGAGTVPAIMEMKASGLFCPGAELP